MRSSGVRSRYVVGTIPVDVVDALNLARQDRPPATGLPLTEIETEPAQPASETAGAFKAISLQAG